MNLMYETFFLSFKKHLKQLFILLFLKELFKFLSEPNELVELNLSSSDIDVEKVFSDFNNLNFSGF